MGDRQAWEQEEKTWEEGILFILPINSEYSGAVISKPGWASKSSGECKTKQNKAKSDLVLDLPNQSL